MLNLNFPSLISAYRRYAALRPEQLFETLGWEGEQGAYSHLRNGALLTSLALLSASVPLSGPLKIESGPLAGSKVQNGANRLAEWLGERHLAPEVFSVAAGLDEVAYQLFGRRGIVAFIQGSGPSGGSIGLLDGHNAGALCAAAQSLHPLEVRFWPVS